MNWDFDEDLGGTFALDKIEAGADPATPVDDLTEDEG